MIVSSIVRSVVLFASRRTHERVNGRRPRGDPLEVISFVLDPDSDVDLGSVFIARQHTDVRY